METLGSVFKLAVDLPYLRRNVQEGRACRRDLYQVPAVSGIESFEARSEPLSAFAAPGDLAVVDGPLGASLGVVQGEGVYVLTTTRMGLLPLTHATRAFRVA